MIISHKKKFIFVHIYKTAGTSIMRQLLPFARPIEKFSFYYPSRYGISLINRTLGLHKYGNAWINGVHKHATVIEANEYLGDEIFNEYYKFAFVRNPYDWLVSLYFYIRQDKWHNEFNKVNAMSFEAFVLERIKNNMPRQKDFLIGQKYGALIVDYVGKIETIDSSYQYICDKLGIKYVKPSNLNQSKRQKSYHQYYNDELTLAVQEYFNDDFETFNYDK
ncbi:sulfotransferase family protein [Francisellaceae bacterium]|nr:sulfotransferase family protein [Francisellaceae bacterium]